MSRLKRYMNPHHQSLEESLRTISRRELVEETVAGSELSTVDQNDSGNTEAIKTMHNILAPFLDDFSRATRGRKRKRSVSLTDISGEPQTEIRLLTHQPILITTHEPMEGWPSQPKISPVEDTEKELEERRRRVMLTAVDFSLVLKQSSVEYPGFKPPSIATYKVKVGETTRHMAITECSKVAPVPVMCRHIEPNQLRSRDPGPKASLLMNTRSPYSHASKPRPRPPIHSFYHSEDTIGGKSAGYAWGYPGSFPRPTGSAGYLRDYMKKGLDEEGVKRLEAGMTRTVSSKTRSGNSRKKQRGCR